MEIEGVISAFVTVFSFGLFFVSLASYRKYKNYKLLFVTIAFLVFLIKGVICSIGLFFEELSFLPVTPISSLFDFIVLLLFFVATIKR